MSLFKTQSLFSIIAETNYPSLGSATITRILYEKPNREKGYWDATVSGTQLIYNVADGDIDQSGKWQLQAYIEVGGLDGFGDIVTQHFDKPLL